MAAPGISQHIIGGAGLDSSHPGLDLMEKEETAEVQ